MKLKTAQLREWLDAHYRGEITYGKVLQNINEFYNPPADAKDKRLTAEELLDRYWKLTRKDGNEDELSPDEVTNLMTIFARQ